MLLNVLHPQSLGIYNDMFAFIGIRPYIPERDLGAFDRFLDEHQINTIFWPVSRRSPSETSSSTIGPADAGPYSHSEIDDSHDIDQNLLDHASYVDQLDRSIDS